MTVLPTSTDSASLQAFEPWLRCACKELRVPYISPDADHFWEHFWLVFDLYVTESMSNTFNIGIDTALRMLMDDGMARRNALVHLVAHHGADPCLCALGELATRRLCDQ